MCVCDATTQTCRQSSIKCIFLFPNVLVAMNAASFGRSPNSFFFDAQTGKRIFGARLTRDAQIVSRTNVPLVGLSMQAHLSKNSDLMVLPSLPVRWARAEFDSSGQRIPVIQPGRRGGEIFGVHLESLHVPIPMEKRADLMLALVKQVFHVVYRPGENWEAEQRKIGQAKGWKEDRIDRFIAKRKEMVHLNKKIWNEKEPNAVYFEPDDYTFVGQSDGQDKVFTVREYMREK